MNRSSEIKSKISTRPTVPIKAKKEFIIKKASPQQIKTKIPNDSATFVDESKNIFQNALKDDLIKSEFKQIEPKSIIDNISGYPINKQSLSIKLDSQINNNNNNNNNNKIMINAYENFEHYQKIEMEKQRQDLIMKTELNEKIRLLNIASKQNQQLKNKIREKDIRISELEEENENLRKELAALKKSFKKNNLERISEYSKNNEDSLDHDSQSNEETKDNREIDNDEIKSLQLALRLEAENLFLANFERIFRLRHHQQHIESEHSIDLENMQNINPDNMTYEQLLRLEEKMGSVNKGLDKEDIKKIPKIVYNKSLKNSDDRCSICFCEFECGEKLRTLPCNHEYHSKCIKPWLLKEKCCPMCKTEIVLK